MTAGRAASSVLDVTVCLLLVSASAVTLTQVPREPDRDRVDRADEVLELLTTSTAWVEYAPTRMDGAANRTAHDTLAGLLAAGAVSNATVHGQSVASTDGFRRAVAAAVRRAIARPDVRVQVVARWRPYPGSHVRGRLAVGPSPPPSADVNAASTTVPLGSSDARRRAETVAPRRGFPGVARVVADELVDGPFSSVEGRSVGRPSRDTRRDAVASAYGIERSSDGPVGIDRLRETVARTVEADLRYRFDSSLEVAEAIAVGQVRLTVRTWSP